MAKGLPVVCVNGDGRPVQAPSLVLCRECLAELDLKMRKRAGQGLVVAGAAGANPCPGTGCPCRCGRPSVMHWPPKRGPGGAVCESYYCAECARAAGLPLPEVPHE